MRTHQLFHGQAVHDVPLVKPSVHPDRNTSPTRLRLERTHPWQSPIRSTRQLRRLRRPCRQAAELLTKIFELRPRADYDMLNKMHAIEHAADKKHHELEDALLTAFITPLEREDLNLMSCSLDTVLDRIEGVVQRVYFTNIQSIHPDAIVIAHKVTDACRAMKDLMVELPNYRKSKTLRELVIQINTIESEADELYINAMRNLHVNGKDPLEVIAWRDVYAFLEYCADCCENVADVVDSIVMKNS
ncbi:MAG: DUF47 domain-containing protein [Collinsella aerofaciens]